jgi:nucleoside-diphosphate-sugar epimerase
MHIFVTGGTGLVGSEIIKQLLEAGHQVGALRQESSSLSLLQDIAHEIKWHEGSLWDILFLTDTLQHYEAVIHAAALVSFHPRQKENLFKINVEATANLVNVCLKLPHIKKFCFISSVSALGINEKDSEKVDEKARWDSGITHSYYGFTKYLAELEVWRAYHEGLPVVIVNPSVVISPKQTTRSSSKLIDYVKKENLFYSLGSFNYVAVSDVAKAVMLLIESNISGERFILSAGTTTYKDFFERLAAILQVKPPRYAITPFLAEIGWRLAALQSFITGKEPFITKETARTAFRKKEFVGQKITKTLPFQYKQLDEMLADFL